MGAKDPPHPLLAKPGHERVDVSALEDDRLLRRVDVRRTSPGRSAPGTAKPEATAPREWTLTSANTASGIAGWSSSPDDHPPSPTGPTTPRIGSLRQAGLISIWTTPALSHRDLVNVVQAAQNGALIAVDGVTVRKVIQVHSPSAGFWSDAAFFSPAA